LREIIEKAAALKHERAAKAPAKTPRRTRRVISR